MVCQWYSGCTRKLLGSFLGFVRRLFVVRLTRHIWAGFGCMHLKGLCGEQKRAGNYWIALNNQCMMTIQCFSKDSSAFTNNVWQIEIEDVSWTSASNSGNPENLSESPKGKTSSFPDSCLLTLRNWKQCFRLWTFTAVVKTMLRGPELYCHCWVIMGRTW